eukprot:TRINITY_DN8129_c0_g1_i1.p1 TRINITY_DN8129_c0_g1~~TRINITY_DN8129_c0_g1_i1.p1  ORF type:complete len:275 (+),score=36.81 TRINITY_DN8129_c0_g1_i1:55-879(+)
MFRSLAQVLRGGRRVWRMQEDRKDLWKGEPIKGLTYGLRKHGGRSTTTGQIAVRHIGGGHKQSYRKIDFRRDLINVPGVVVRKEYDPCRTAHIALVAYPQNILSYILAPEGIKPGDIVRSGTDLPSTLGNTLPLQNIMIGTRIHNIEVTPGGGGRLIRSAGAFATLLGRDPSGYDMIRLMSGELRLLHPLCRATVGAVSNSSHHHRILGKAGVSRWLGIRPTVRGIAMNPVDHPHGGRGNGGRPSVTPWAKPCKGHRTRRVKKSNQFILRRRKA